MMRRKYVLVKSVIDKLLKLNKEFVIQLYLDTCMSHDADTCVQMYQTESVRKWMHIEDACCMRHYEVRTTRNPDIYPKGIAINLTFICEYLGQQLMIVNGFRGKYDFLSNFYPCKIVLDGLEYKCAESAFQAYKTTDMKIRKQFCNLSAKDAKAKGRKVELRDDWEDVKINVMRRVVRKKFKSSNKLKYLLMQTGDAVLMEENNWNDTFWGTCKGRGENQLGRILMQVRSELLEAKENGTNRS